MYAFSVCENAYHLTLTATGRALTRELENTGNTKIRPRKMTRSIIAILLLCLPFLEIAGFVVVGRQIGVLPTLLLVVASIVLGMIILRRQGFQALAKLRQRSLPRDLPVERFFDTALVLLAGLLLIVPGFVSDLIALTLLLPFVRRFVAGQLAARVVVVNFAAAGAPSEPRDPGPASPRTIDLDSDDYTRKDPP